MLTSLPEVEIQPLGTNLVQITRRYLLGRKDDIDWTNQHIAPPDSANLIELAVDAMVYAGMYGGDPLRYIEYLKSNLPD